INPHTYSVVAGRCPPAGVVLASHRDDRRCSGAMILTLDEPPKSAIGNLRFTSRGVYAEYLLSGLPFIFQSKEVQDQVADTHADLLRALPSGALLEGLTAPVATRNMVRR